MIQIFSVACLVSGVVACVYTDTFMFVSFCIFVGLVCWLVCVVSVSCFGGGGREREQSDVLVFQGFPARMVYLYYISCLRYTILVGNPRFNFSESTDVSPFILLVVLRIGFPLK